VYREAAMPNRGLLFLTERALRGTLAHGRLGDDKGQSPCDLEERATNQVAARLRHAHVDPLLTVWWTFRLMPLEDRATIVGAIERGPGASSLAKPRTPPAGTRRCNAPPYLRSHEAVVPRNLLERDELMLAMLSGMRVTPLLLVPDIHAAWVDGTREALEHIDADARAAVVQLLREALGMVEGADPTPPSPEDRAARAN
jgi:hypothetical protein